MKAWRGIVTKIISVWNRRIVKRWRKEHKIIKGYGMLYPEFENVWNDTIRYQDFCELVEEKAYWVTVLSRHQLKRRIPSLEMFIKHHNDRAWYYYTRYFGIKE